MGESSFAIGASNLNDSHAKDTEAVITLNKCGSLCLLYAITLFEAGARKWGMHI